MKRLARELCILQADPCLDVVLGANKIIATIGSVSRCEGGSVDHP